MKHLSTIFALGVILLFGCSGPGAKQSLAHFWDDYDFASLKGLDPIDDAEQHFADYMTLLSKVDTATAAASIRDFMDKAKADTVSYLVYSDFFVSALYPLGSPWRDADLLRVYLRKALSDGLVADYQRFDEEQMLRKSYLTLKGTIAEDGHLLLENGDSTSVLALAAESPRTRLLLVGQAGCRSCVDIMKDMAEKTPDRVRLVAVVEHSYRGEAEWLRKQLPDRWTVVCAGESFLDSYDYGLATVSYILNSKGKILSIK